jgi:hypothetical protein
VLKAFVAGSMPEARAIAVAEHVDSCAVCQQALFALDDLHQELMGCAEEPIPPPDLVESILSGAGVHAQRASRRGPGPAPAVAIALLGAAGLLFAVLGEPAQVVTDGVTMGVGLGVVASLMGGPSGLGGWAVAPGLVMVAGIMLAGSHVAKRFRR